LAGTTVKDYRGDLAHFAGSLIRRRSVFGGTVDDVAAWFHAHTRDEEDTLDQFLEGFPTATREHALAVLELARDSVIATAAAVQGTPTRLGNEPHAPCG
jgi:hypothetical protein